MALVSPYPPPGGGLRSGVEWVTRSLAAALAAAGAQVTVVAQEVPGAPTVAEDGAVTVLRRFRRGPRALAAAVEAAAGTAPDVVHVEHEVFLYGGPGSVPALPWALRRLGRLGLGPVVTLHQVVRPATVDAGFTRMHRVRVPPRLARAALAGVQESVRRASAAVVVHEAPFADIVRGSRVIPLGVDRLPTVDPADARRRLGVGQASLVVLCFGFIAPYKGIEVVADAARLAGPDVQLVVAGGPHPRLDGRDPYAGDLARRYGSDARFTGFVPDDEVGLWFSAADLVVVPHPRPFSSSGPLALAMAYGRPVLLSPAMAACVGAPAELTLAATAEPLAARLRQLAGDAGARERVARGSAALAEGRTWGAVAGAHLALYGEVIGAGRARGVPRLAG